MNIFHYMFILLFPSIFSYPYRYSNDLNQFLNMYVKRQERNLDETNKKFGSPRQYMLHPLPSYYEEKPLQKPLCLPHIWSCGPHLPPCCPGLMCYDGNAKRGRYCVAKG
ncbi:unnamed protein product [Rotaria sp. Silwood1]|nr:unnamed protein product [Rotaria sp. Silwood1]CAF0969387.1 unnamed protein product [Rotaria sp. Silwood1]CAF3392727.1 unnamed protein product [Rotaria sp. Silwood1]CAF4824680.1 unnamed protein product [Rotaria sp. Silwood1]